MRLGILLFTPILLLAGVTLHAQEAVNAPEPVAAADSAANAELKAQLKTAKAAVKAATKELTKAETKKAAAETKAAENAKKAEAEAVLKKLLASGMSAEEIVSKLQ